MLRARRDDDAELVVRTDAAIGCLIVDWGRKGLQGKAAQLISLTRKRGLDVPVIVLVRGRHRLEDIPVEVLDDVDGFMVATGINRDGDFYNIEPAKLARLLKLTRQHGAKS